jgi:3-dehydroquinate dehydratase-2
VIRNRVEVIHGVNLDQLGRRDPRHYGTITFDQLEQRIGEWCQELDLIPRFFQTNHEGELVEHLHRLEDLADGVLINAGAWTHYSWAARDALELTGLPTVEVHLSDIHAREAWRAQSVFDGLVVAQVAGQGPEGYREALECLRSELASD